MELKVISRKDIDLSNPPTPDPAPAGGGGDNPPAPAGDNPAGDPPAPAPDPAKPAGDNPPAPAPAGDPTKPAGPAAPPQTVDFEAELAKISGGAVKTQAELTQVFAELEALRAQLAEKETLVNSLKPKDEFISGLVAHYNETGSYEDYVQVMKTDFSQMEPKDILRHKIEKENEGLSRAALDKLYNRELEERYQDADDNSAEDREIGQARLKKEMAQYVSQFEAKKGEMAKKAVKLPQTETPEQAAERVRKANEQVDSHPSTKEFTASKSLSLVEGFKYGVESIADTVVASAKDAGKFFDMVILRDDKGAVVKDADGNPQMDLNKWFSIVAFANNPKGMLDAHVNYGKTLGKEEAMKQRDNPNPGLDPNGGGHLPAPKADSLLDAFEAGGVKKRRSL